MKPSQTLSAATRCAAMIRRQARSAKRTLRTRRAEALFHFTAIVAVCTLLYRTCEFTKASPTLTKAYISSWKRFSVNGTNLDANSYPTPSALDDFIANAVRYIIRTSDSGSHDSAHAGMFAYQYMLRPNGSISQSSDYNTMHHCGAAHALADACPPMISNTLLPSYCNQSRHVLIRATDWLIRTVSPIGDSGELGIWSRPSGKTPDRIQTNHERGEVRPGGIGVGLITLIAGLHSGNAQVNITLLRDVARGATDVLQRHGGVMGSHVSGLKMGVDRDRPNGVYGGETALGLLQTYEHNGNITLQIAASRTLQAIARYSGIAAATGHTPSCDYWALISTAALFRSADYAQHSSSAERRLLVRHARRVCRICYEGDRAQLGRNVVTSRDLASSVEGQLAMLPLLRAVGAIDDTESDPILCGARQSLAAVMSMQYRDDGTGVRGGALLDGGVAGGGELVVVRGGYRVRARFDGVFRIDSTTHALSAALAYLRVASIPRFRTVRCELQESVIDLRGVSNVVYENEGE